MLEMKDVLLASPTKTRPSLLVVPQISEPAEIGADAPKAELIISTINKWWQAWLDKDMATIAAMASNHYMELTKDGRSLLMGKTALLASAQEFFDSVVVGRWEIRDPAVEVLCDDAAICRYHTTFCGTFGNSGKLNCSYDGVATDVLIVEEGDYKYVAHYGGFHPSLLLPSLPPS